MLCVLSHSVVSGQTPLFIGVLQARILEWVVIPSSRDLPDPGIEPGSPALQVDFLPAELPGKPIVLFAEQKSMKKMLCQK